MEEDGPGEGNLKTGLASAGSRGGVLTKVRVLLIGGGAARAPGAGGLGARAQPGRGGRRSQQPGHGVRVMLVDDQLNVARASAMLFEQLGYRTTVFTDPREALAAFRKTPQQFDLVMTDPSMPQMSGSELAIAVHSLRSELPVILTSGRDVTPEVRQTLGDHTVLQKPWRLEDALQQVMPQG